MKYLYTFILLTISLNSFAQLSKDLTYFGGSIKYNKTKVNVYNEYPYEADNKIFTVAPEIGVMISDVASIGTRLSYTTENDGTTNNNYSFEASLYYRRNNMFADKLYFFTEPELSYTKSFTTISETDIKIKYLKAQLNLGLMYMISKQLSLELNLFNLSYSQTIGNDDTTPMEVEATEFNFDLDITSPTLGIKYYFNSKK